MRLIRVVLAVFVLIAMAGCSRGPVATDPTPPTAEPATNVPNDGVSIVDLSDEAIAGKDLTRVALLEVAHAAVGTSQAEPFYVWQLYVQGASAVGDLQASDSGHRVLLVFEHDGKRWNAVYQEKFIDSSEAEMRAASPRMSAELAERVDFVVPIEVDAFYTDNADALVAKGKKAGMSDMAVYAPTRLPEGFEMVYTEGPEASINVHYALDSQWIAYLSTSGSDYGERVPDFDFEGLRFGDVFASMDSSFEWDEYDAGPHLALRDDAIGEHYLQGEGISPGMVAAVAEGMVRVK